MEMVKVTEYLGCVSNGTVYEWALIVLENDRKYYLAKSGNFYLNESNDGKDEVFLDEDDILDVVEKDSKEVEEILEMWREERE
jgi:hypothetical protein